MTTKVLKAARSGPGCQFREIHKFFYGDTSIELVVSNCQLARFDAGLDALLDRLQEAQFSAQDAQRFLQSWIDSGSPCDFIYADDPERTEFLESVTPALPVDSILLGIAMMLAGDMSSSERVAGVNRVNGILHIYIRD